MALPLHQEGHRQWVHMHQKRHRQEVRSEGSSSGRGAASRIRCCDIIAGWRCCDVRAGMACHWDRDEEQVLRRSARAASSRASCTHSHAAQAVVDAPPLDRLRGLRAPGRRCRGRGRRRGPRLSGAARSRSRITKGPPDSTPEAGDR